MAAYLFLGRSYAHIFDVFTINHRPIVNNAGDFCQSIRAMLGEPGGKKIKRLAPYIYLSRQYDPGAWFYSSAMLVVIF